MQIDNLTKDLDAKTLKETTGGDNGNSAVNTVGQVMNLSAPVATLSGGPSNTMVDIDAKQKADIFTGQQSGDAFIVGLPNFDREKI
jgi:hypothetical protein